tara:strand:+ start:356 stop:574 length:219 start_codon:yes stop_codon:yes gene_type:complete
MTTREYDPSKRRPAVMASQKQNLQLIRAIYKRDGSSSNARYPWRFHLTRTSMCIGCLVCWVAIIITGVCYLA